MLEKYKITDLLLHFLDLLLLVFLFYDIGFSTEKEYVIHTLILLPSIVFILIGFNVYKFLNRNFYPSVRKRAQYNLIILISLVLVNVLVVLFRFENSLADTFYANRNILEYGLLLYYFIRLSFLMRLIYNIYFNPFILFVGRFILVIFLASF